MDEAYSCPIDLQFGNILPAVTAFAGPGTKGKCTTRKGALNLFCMNVAAKGVGKSLAKAKFVEEPAEYCAQHIDSFPDLIANKFTRAGLEDKVSTTHGYCLVISDEATSFFEDLKRSEVRHESYVGMLNQFFDGQGDHTVMAGDNFRRVPNNAVSIIMSIQHQSYIAGLQSLGHQAFVDTGLNDRFLTTAIAPWRYEIVWTAEIFSGDFLMQHKYITFMFKHLNLHLIINCIVNLNTFLKYVIALL